MAGDKIKNARIAARARNYQEDCFGPKVSSDPIIQNLYKHLADAQKGHSFVDLRFYHAQSLIAAEYLFIRRYLFPLVSKKSADRPVLKVHLHHAKLKIEYRPWHGHFGNFFASILNAPRYRYAFKYSDISTALYVICQREKEKQFSEAKGKFEQNFSIALGVMLIFYLKTGQDAFNKYSHSKSQKEHEKSFYVKFDKKTGVSFTLSNQEIVLIEFLFYLLGVKEIARRLGVNAYHGVHYEHTRCALCYGKGIGFALYHAVALDLIKNGALLFWDYIDPTKPYALFTTYGMTRFMSGAQGLNRSREKCFALTQLWQERSVIKDKLSQSRGVCRLFSRVLGAGSSYQKSSAYDLVKTQEDSWDQADQFGHICE